MTNYKNLDVVNVLLKALGIPQMTKDDLELIGEYMSILKPLAAVLDIFQGEKACFMGLGVVLPLLSKLQKQLRQKICPNLSPIRDKIIARVEVRYTVCAVLVFILLLT